jgi:5-formyltetrahydrofolate cyclo-ligase
MLKEEARKIYKAKRKTLLPAEQSKQDDLMLIQFQTAGLPFLKTLLTYWPIEENKEPNTQLFAQFLQFRNPELRICYPVTDFNSGTMQAISTDLDTAFEKTARNISEPVSGDIVPASSIDMVFVPLLAFDSAGYRVGYGLGFYDKFLATAGEDCIKVGFSYFEPIGTIEDRNDFDVPLDLCITPQNVYVF